MAFLNTLNLDADQRYELLNFQQVFFYMSPVGDTLRDRCYQLQVVPHEEIDPSNYFTLSRCSKEHTCYAIARAKDLVTSMHVMWNREGVTHFRGKDSEFTPLPQWNREYRLFNKIAEVGCSTDCTLML